MLYYNHKLKCNARRLRSSLTTAEILLWSRIRRKQLLNVQFYRQKPLGNYIVDFFASSPRLIIELDGGQHFEEYHMCKDKERDAFMGKQGFKVLRFDNLQILHSINDVMDCIFNVLEVRLGMRETLRK